MSRSEKVEVALGKAEELEKEYDWAKAADRYKQGVGAIGKKDFFRKGEIQERIGYCFHRAAMQAESQEEFKQRMQQAIEAYEKAHGFYEKLTGKQKMARMLRCKSVAKYLAYWLTSDPSEKRGLLDECLELESRVLAVFLEFGDMLEYGRTYSELPLVFWLRHVLEWDRQTLKSILERGIKWGQKATTALSKLGYSYETARASLPFADCSSWMGYYFTAEPEQQEKYRLEVVKHLSRAIAPSEKAGDAFLLGFLHFWLGGHTGGEEAVRHYEKALECGKQTRDNFLIANSQDLLAYMTYWRGGAAEDPGQREKLAKKAMEFYDKAQHHFSIISFQSPRGGFIGPPAGYAEHYYFLASFVETDPEKKLELLEKSEKVGMKALKAAEASDIPEVVSTVLHIVSKTLEARARIEPEVTKKRSRLEKALKYRERTIEHHDRLKPFDYWNGGVMQNYLAGIRVELADIEPDLDSKRRLLEEAVLSKEKCLKLCNKAMPYFEKMGETNQFAGLQWYQDTYATLLTQLYDLANNPDHLRKAVEVQQKAIESARKLDIVSRIAESHWKIARAQDVLKEPLKAAENFERASESYMKAAEKIPQLKDLYQDYASYMEAWNEIEKGRYHHAKRRYAKAKEHYAKAAEFHESTQRWKYLGKNYLAWAKLEEAEDLSRQEQGKKATEVFKEAADLFCKAKNAIKTKLKEMRDIDERKLATRLIKASDMRHKYCQGRITLEKAKILDRQGDHTESSENYGTAAETFQEIAKTGSEQTCNELQPIIYLCQAWQKMMMAEAKSSSTMYGEAAELFKEAKEHILDQPTGLLALANSSFCKALEAGTQFEMTRDMTVYSIAKKHMKAAANHYLKAGFKTASEYARATHRLFDAYIYMEKAEAEIEPRKKAQYYEMAEKLLEASAGSYMKAKHPEKCEEVRRLLESVKEERQLAMSLTKVLHAPLIASTTASFSTPAPTHEQAVGLERFEHADIQANLILRLKEVKVGEDVDLEIELVNAGKAPALLIKVEKLIPQDFEVKGAPQIYRVEDSYLNMKGRRLAPLKTEEIRLVLRPATKGAFTLKPRIMYLDETGKYRSHEPEPVTITVKELGIKGWIRGER